MRDFYVAGPISNVKNYNREAFKAVENYLNANGYSCYNPNEYEVNFSKALEQVESNNLISETFPEEVMTLHWMSIPIKVTKESAVWQEAMREAVSLLLKCKAVVFLPGWQESRGAQIEYRLSLWLGMPVFHISEEQFQHILEGK